MRLQHRYAVSEDSSLSVPANVSLSSVGALLGGAAAGLTPTFANDAVEVSLTANQNMSSMRKPLHWRTDTDGDSDGGEPGDESDLRSSLSHDSHTNIRVNRRSAGRRRLRRSTSDDDAHNTYEDDNDDNDDRIVTLTPLKIRSFKLPLIKQAAAAAAAAAAA